MTVIMYVDGVQVEFLFAVARWGQRNAGAGHVAAPHVGVFLFAVARWGQRNPTPADELLTSANAVRFHTRPKFGRTSVT